MKISRLYLRILGAFILVQIISIMVMFILVRAGKIRPPFTRAAEERTLSLKAFVERDIAGSPIITPVIRERINTTIEVFSSAFRSAIWVSDQSGEIISKSNDKPIPPIREFEYDHEFPLPDGGSLFLLSHRDMKSVYATINAYVGTKPLTIHILHRWKKRKEEAWFMRGLLLTSTISALLLIPGTRRITRPLNQLTESAQKVGKGDFSPRVKVKGKGEISELADTFNHMAESLEKMVRGGKELTANLSHELRSPLTRIRLSQQIMQDRIEDGRTDGIEKHLGKMEEEISHMDSLIDKILSLSKLDLQEQQPPTATVDLSQMIEEAVERLQPLMLDKGLRISQHCSDVPEFTCRADDIRIVLDNVVANAVKYSPENSRFTVSCSREKEAIIVRVSNPYAPLSNEELETIFIPFKRLGYDNVDGNGLGLAFARKIVEDHGGTMHASSEDQGFTMIIRFPEA